MSAIREEDAVAAAGLVGERWMKLKGARILLTGATGFLGGSLIETFLHANERFGLDARVVVLTRDPQSAQARHPWLSNKAIDLIAGDVATFETVPGSISHCIHGAAVSSIPLALQDGAQISRTIVDGTRRCLEVATRSHARDFLLISSGAVYGPQPMDLGALSEDFPMAPLGDSPRDQYARAKRAAEDMCLAASAPLAPRVARCFAFLGPGIPLDAHYAAGNFIRDALTGGPIIVDGDGMTMRSYLYTSDAAAWLWTMLLSDTTGVAYNVGSPEGVTIAGLAHEIARNAGNTPVVIRGQSRGGSAQRYVPSVSRAATQLGLRPSVPLSEAVRRTLAWARSSATPVAKSI